MPEVIEMQRDEHGIFVEIDNSSISNPLPQPLVSPKKMPKSKMKSTYALPNPQQPGPLDALAERFLVKFMDKILR